MALGLVLNRSRQVPAEDSPAFGAIAERFRRAGDLERAVSLCQEGLRRFPSHVSARVTLGWSLLDLGRYDEARAELEQALKRAPDNLAAIRGLAELHDRSEHDEVAAMQRSGVKWMSEVAASAAPSEAEAPHAGPTPVEPPTMPSASFAAADPLVARASPSVPETDEIAASLEALRAFSSGIDPAPAPKAVASDFAKPSINVAAQSAPTPAPVSAPAPASKSVAAPDPLAGGPWQPVEIETAAAHVLSSAAAAPVVIEPVVLTSASDVVLTSVSTFAAPTRMSQPVEPAHSELDDFDAPLPAPAAAGPSFESFESLTEGIDEGVYGLPAGLETELERMSSAPVEPVTRAAASAIDPEVPAAIVKPLVLTPVVDMPVAASAGLAEFAEHEEFDPELPAGTGEWSEMASDAFVLSAAIEAERATADEGPGPWPPVIPDDPVVDSIGDSIGEPAAPAVAAMKSVNSSSGASAKIQRPSVTALNRFLRRVETRRATVVSQYLAG